MANLCLKSDEHYNTMNDDDIFDDTADEMLVISQEWKNISKNRLKVRLKLFKYKYINDYLLVRPNTSLKKNAQHTYLRRRTVQIKCKKCKT